VDSTKINEMFESNTKSLEKPKKSFGVSFIRNEKKQPKVKISTPTSVSHQSHIGYESNSEQYKEKYNFDEFMNNPDSLIRKYFKKSLENLYCAENFYFHEGVEIYRILHDEKDIVNQANYLWNTFLDPKSKYELNITKLERDHVQERLNEYPKDLFDKLDKEILLTLKNENYGKFLTSEEFKQFLKEKDGKITFFELLGILNVKGISGFVDSTKINQMFENNEKKQNVKNEKKNVKNPTKLKISTPIMKEEKIEREDLKDRYNFDEFICDSNSVIRKYFKEFLKNLNYVEKYYFHEDVEMFKSLKERKEKGESIIKNYSKQIEKLNNIEVLDENAFDEIDKEIVLHFKNNFYSKFLQSAEFKKFLKTTEMLNLLGFNSLLISQKLKPKKQMKQISLDPMINSYWMTSPKIFSEKISPI
jgi:hypothetical protein